MEELKECPFCGGEAKIYSSSDGGICVKCMECGCQSSYDCDLCLDDCLKRNAFEHVVKAWNRRRIEDD
jgi:hypothetical protein